MAVGERRIVQDDEGGRVVIEKIDDLEALMIHEAPGAGVVLSQTVFPSKRDGMPKLMFVDWDYWTLLVDGERTTLDASVASGQWARVRSMEADPYSREIRFST